MTAATDPKTLTLLERTAELTEFIHGHGDKLGSLVNFSISSSQSLVQISSFSQTVRDEHTAAALIAWSYLLDAPRFEAYKSKTFDDLTCAHIDLCGSLQGHPMQVYATVHGDRSAYILSLDEVSVHAVRRIQVDDVPAVDTEAVLA